MTTQQPRHNRQHRRNANRAKRRALLDHVAEHAVTIGCTCDPNVTIRTHGHEPRAYLGHAPGCPALTGLGPGVRATWYPELRPHRPR